MSKKITDEELEQEVRKDKTEKEIAYDNGYSYPSKTLNQRIRKLGYEKNQKLTLQKSNAATFYFPTDTMQELAEQKGFSLDEADKLFFQVDTGGEDGVATLEITKDSFCEVDE